MYKVVLFYKYTRINDPEALKTTQKALLAQLNMKGRMIIAHEGINATFEGTNEAIAEYISQMKADSRFADIHWKISDGTEKGTALPRLSVKVRKEIVSLHLIDGANGEKDDIDPNNLTGTHLKPEELRSWYEAGKEFYIVDMRNDYELKSGKFENTIFPGMENFRDLREKVQEIAGLKNKTVLTVCTGGVRCEKASGYLKREGFENVFQLDGGIVTYMEKYPGKDFLGSLYVFDKRLTMHFEEPSKHRVIGLCEKCGISSEHYVNCANLNCHKHFICCEGCLDGTEINKESGGEAYCDDNCRTIWNNRVLKN
ncbi:MAG: hypothetical protein RL641_190 [Candidatus Parcubacteria bacterium]|jgi:UPF0176 protein